MIASDTVTAISTISAIVNYSQSAHIPLMDNLQIILRVLGVSASVGIIGYLGYLANLHQGFQTLKSLSQSIKNWWLFKIPAQKVLGNISDNKTELKVFVRDFFIQPGTTLYSRDGLNGPVGTVPNVHELWPMAEGIGLSKIFNTLGKLDKTENIEVVEMGKDPGIWNRSLIILGAQTQKCFDFYQKMQEVAFRVSSTDIIRTSDRYRINRFSGYGYGIVLKCKNPFVKGNKGVSFLIGGFGVLGTEAATYYFANHLEELGKGFGSRSFGVVVRASITAGVQSTERLKNFDVRF